MWPTMWSSKSLAKGEERSSRDADWKDRLFGPYSSAQ
jgi:hypothetical protein